MKKTQTKIRDLEPAATAKRFPDVDTKDLRRTVGGLRPTVTTGASTFNCDDWCDCD